MDCKHCCGTCKWHIYETENDDWACINKESEYYTDFTGYSDVCDEWESHDETDL